ncbi:MAG: STAS domain-containing protein [Trebonia sp.]
MRTQTGTYVPDMVSPNPVPPQPVPLELSHRLLPTGEVVADIGGELDMATADTAARYVQRIISSHRGPVSVDLAGIRFCDAQGLHALLRMANYAEQLGFPFHVTSPTPMLAKLMRITGVGYRLRAPGAGER